MKNFRISAGIRLLGVGPCMAWCINNKYGSAVMYRALTSPSNSCHIGSIQINPEHRGQGLGTAFMQALERRAKKEKMTSITLEVASMQSASRPNPRLRRWYMRLGYKAVPNTQGFIRYKRL